MNWLAERCRPVVALLAILGTMAAGTASADGGGDDWHIRFVYRYSLDSSTATSTSGLDFNIDRARTDTFPAMPPVPAGASLSCVDCSDAEYRRLAVIYGLLLVIGYQVTREALDD